MPRMDEAAGMTPLTTVPGGATISRGRNMPAVLGISSRSTDRTHRATTEDVKESVLLMAPPHLRISAGKVGPQLVSRHGDLHLQTHRRPSHPVAVHIVDKGVAAVGQEAISARTSRSV